MSDPAAQPSDTGKELSGSEKRIQELVTQRKAAEASLEALRAEASQKEAAWQANFQKMAEAIEANKPPEPEPEPEAWVDPGDKALAQQQSFQDEVRARWAKEEAARKAEAETQTVARTIHAAIDEFDWGSKENRAAALKAAYDRHGADAYFGQDGDVAAFVKQRHEAEAKSTADRAELQQLRAKSTESFVSGGVQSPPTSPNPEGFPSREGKSGAEHKAARREWEQREALAMMAQLRAGG